MTMIELILIIIIIIVIINFVSSSVVRGQQVFCLKMIFIEFLPLKNLHRTKTCRLYQRGFVSPCLDNETGPAAVAERRRDPMANLKK